MFGLRKAVNIEVVFPFTEIIGNSEGPVVLITAGMDGDEYAGIEAAYRLITYFQSVEFPGIIRIVPIVNVPGFESGTSWNPLDKKYPKHFFPGKKNGTASEQLIYSLWQQMGKNVTLWLDLHGGARNEKLNPYVLGFKTNNDLLNRKMKNILGKIHYKTTVITNWEKVNTISKSDCLYIVFEAGDRGSMEEFAVNLHLQWAKNAVNVFQSMQDESNIQMSYFQKETRQISHWDGIFVPEILQNEIEKNMRIGTIYSLNKRKSVEIRANHPGYLLYHRVYSWVTKGEELLTLASEKITE